MQKLKLILCCVLFAFAAQAQYTTIGSSDTPAGSLGVLNAKLAFTITSSAPSTCITGKEVYIDSGTLKWYLCTATNTWSEIVTVGQSYSNPAWIAALAYAKITGVPAFAATTGAVTSQWLKSYNATTGAFTQTQPAAGDISGLAASATTDTTSATNISSGTLAFARFPVGLSIMSALGDSMYGGASGALTRLAGNTTVTRKFYRQTGDGVNSAAPAWDTVTATDVGLPNVDNTSDANKPVSTAQATALALKEATANKGAASGYAPLDSNAKLPVTHLQSAVNAQTGTTYTVLDSDRGKLVTHTNAASIAVTLPQAGAGAAFLAGWLVDVQNRGAGTATITPSVSTIDGAASLALTTGQGVKIVSDGTNYFTQRGVGGGSMVYPGAGVPLSTGSAWGTSYAVGTGANNLPQLDSGGKLLTGVLPNPGASALGGVQSAAAEAGKFIDSISTGGVPNKRVFVAGDISAMLPSLTVSGSTTVAPFPACPVSGFDRTVVYSTDLTAASGTISVTIGTAPAAWVWDSVWGRETVTFAGTNMTTATVSIGPSGSETAILPAVGLKQATNTTTAFSPGYSPGQAATAILAQFVITTGGGTFSNASAGTYDIRVCGHAGR